MTLLQIGVHLFSVNSRATSTLLAVTVMVLSGLSHGHAGEPLDPTRTFNVTEENGSFNGSDYHYTQGLRLSYATGERTSDGLASLANAIFLSSESNQHLRFSYFLGQSIFTPEDNLLAQPDPHDRPYAGWLYAGADFYRQTEHSLDRAEITVGWVGPGAGAGAVQNWFHGFFAVCTSTAGARSCTTSQA